MSSVIVPDSAGIEIVSFKCTWCFVLQDVGHMPVFCVWVCMCVRVCAYYVCIYAYMLFSYYEREEAKNVHRDIVFYCIKGNNYGITVHGL